MNSIPELAIVIPAKNEKLLLPRLLGSLARQSYPLLSSTTVFIADAGSTDGTAAAAERFKRRLSVSVIGGGLPARGRNLGAIAAQSRYVLFIDADMELPDPTFVHRAVKLMQRRGLHCVTTSIRCREGDLRDSLLYAGNNLAQLLSRYVRPFSTGMFMLFDRRHFLELGGFNEKALYAEDYLLSKQVARDRFAIVEGYALTTNRRFRKMGHGTIMRLFFRTAWNTWNDAYFLQDQHYWTT